MDGSGASEARHAPPQTALDTDAIEIGVHERMGAIEAEWRRAATLWPISVYQNFDWVDCWVSTATGPQRIRPALVTLRIAGRLAAILPLGIERVGPLRIARFLGGEHANIRMPLFDPALFARLDAEGSDRLLGRIARAIKGIDLIDLDAMPVMWDGRPVPLAAHPVARPARTDVGAMALGPDFKAVLAAHHGARKAKKHRWQVNALAPVGGYMVRRAADADEALALLDAYFAQKAAWFRAQGIADSFAEPGVAAFFRALVARRWRTGAPIIELDAVIVDGAVQAILGSGTEHGRLSGYFLSVANTEWRRISPGELLIHDVVAASCTRGLAILDLGRGDERYKTSWLDQREPHVRVLIGVTWRGRLAVALFGQAGRVERALRGNPRLWGLAKSLRRRLGGRRTEPAGAD
ncbi:GNAT family N-acetyltransferase [Kaistia dalseonensis]|uniref:CelD/BcsL family acetyltransferase involved in cellulose biosynthesis n=1 Tax=Kaistia dalseonensis TaxID=410840 RepID=A0ABU0H1L8_9HYPH|nr:GNAT family N-acetyltransferase [Kaistia dalseonensis]MCX5493643.1 GNAT family N-acetyltransferase [Kaistia dalseonensis]MDQ0436205.1 CelD/BcsL family acetyltransferase involved in cellulose biosynthesis [Kaistia dalseonensis]